MSESLLAFLGMGGYARYVWPSYGIAIGTIVLAAWTASRRLKATRAAVKRLVDDGDVPQEE